MRFLRITNLTLAEEGKMNIKNKKALVYLGSFVIVAILNGCAAPQAVTEKANSFLKGSCRELFLSTKVLQYQHVAQAPTGRAVFALADHHQAGQFCAWASNRDNDVKESSFEIYAPWEKLEIAAIGRCEAVKPAHVNTPCKIFARNNEITWGQQKKIGLD